MIIIVIGIVRLESYDFFHSDVGVNLWTLKVWHKSRTFSVHFYSIDPTFLDI